MHPPSATSSELLGVQLHAVPRAQLFAAARVWIRAAGRRTVMYLNVHVANLAHADPALRAALNRADLVYCDGFGVRLGAALLGQPLPERATGADFIWELAGLAAAEGWRVFWVGGAAGVAAAALERLRARCPTLQLAGAQHGFFAKEGAESDEVVAAINAARPDLVLVGMGTPTQELWVDRNRAHIDAPLVWCIGATADFLAGVQPRGPRWMTDHGLEWAYRLASDPRRLFGRYVIGNPLFLARVLRARIFGR